MAGLLRKALILSAFLTVSIAHADFIPVKPQNLIFYAPMNEGRGTVAYDYSSFGSSIALMGNATWSKDVGHAGKTVSYASATWYPTGNGAVYIPAVATNFLEVAPHSRWNFQGNPFSLIIIFNKEVRGSAVSLLNTTGDCSAGGFNLGITAGNQIHFTRCGIDQNNWTTFPAFDRPIMLGFSSDGSDVMKFYLNGNLDNRLTGKGALQSNSDTKRLVICGDNPSGMSACQGMVAGVGIWNKVLSDDDFKTMWQSAFGTYGQ